MNNKKCCNCGGGGVVSVNINCPSCTGNGYCELDVLRKLADLMRLNLAMRSRPPKWLVEILNKINKSQGR